MSRLVLVLLPLLLVLSGCVGGPHGYLKTSANNKLFDSKGFQGSKRAPLYNEKYISIAKKNVKTDNLEEDDLAEDEKIHPSARNKQIYLKMLKESKDSGKNDYPSLNQAAKNLDRENTKDQVLRLEKELVQAKALIAEVKKELVKIQKKDEVAKTKDSEVQIVKKPVVKTEPKTAVTTITKTDDKPAASKPAQSSVKQKFLTSDEDDNIIVNDDKADSKANNKASNKVDVTKASNKAPNPDNQTNHSHNLSI